MKILAVTHFYIEDNRAGGEMMLHALLKKLAEKHEVTVVAIETKLPSTHIDGIEVLYHVDPQMEANRIKPDVIITQFHKTPVGKSIGRRMKIPVVTIIHNNHPRTKMMIFDNNVRNMLVFNTNWIKEDAKHHIKSIVVHPPIDREVFRTTPGDHVTLVNIAPEKGVELFYKLAERLPQYKFLGVKGGYFKNLQDVRELPNVTIIENTPNMRDDVYAKSKIVLMPSSYESFGMVAAEAIVSGIPVIAHPTIGLKENLGYAGVFRDRDDVDAWEQDIISLMENKALYDELSKLCKKRSLELDTDRELEEFVKAIEGLHGRK